MTPLNQLSDFDQEQLRKLIEDGVEISTQSMAKLTQREWELTSVGLKDGQTTHFMSIFEKSPDMHAGVQLWSKGSYPMLFLLMFSPKSSEALTNAMSKAYQLDLGDPAQARKLVLEEVGNILISSFLKKLANTLQQTILTSTPEYLEASKKELLSKTLASLGEKNGAVKDHAVVVHIGMCSASLSADCDLMILADPDCLKELVDQCAEREP